MEKYFRGLLCLILLASTLLGENHTEEEAPHDRVIYPQKRVSFIIR